MSSLHSIIYFIQDPDTYTTTIWKTESGVGFKVISDFPPAPSGYYYSAWTGWNGQGESYQPGDTIFIEAGGDGISLYAYPHPEIYSISYQANNSMAMSSNPNPSTYNIKSSTITLKDATSSSYVDYVFRGWFTSPNVTPATRVYEIPSGSTGNRTFYARFLLNGTGDNFTMRVIGDQGCSPVWRGTTSNEYSRTVQTHDSFYYIDWQLKQGYVQSHTSVDKDIFGSGVYGYVPEFTGPDKLLVYGLTSGPITARVYTEPVEYPVSYNLAGGTGSHSNITSYTINTPPYALVQGSVTRTGYTFKGWYTAASGGSKVTTIAGGEIGNKTLYAQWTPITYTIVFDGRGGTSPINKSVPYDTAVGSLTDSTRAGYIFKGWYTAASGGSKVTSSTTNLRNTAGTVTIYAQWTAITYTITYSAGDTGVTHTNPTNYTSETSTITLNGTAPAGYTFVGWFTGANGTGTKYTTIVKGSVGNLTLYAHRSINTYQINYALGDDSIYPGDNSNTTNPSEYTVESSKIVFDTLGISRPGWTPAGWNISSIEAGSTGNKTITMTWSPVQYKTYWRDTDGDYTAEETSFDYKTSDVHTKSLTYSISKPKTGYLPSNRTFQRTGSEGVNYGGAAPYNSNYPSSNDFIVPRGTYGDIYTTYTYYPIKYNLNFNLNAGSGTTPAQITGLEYDKTITGNGKSLPTTGYSRSGYLFKGWYTLASGGTKIENSSKNISAVNNTTVTLYAQWTEINYKVKFINPETSVTYSTYSLTYEQELSQLPNRPTNPGHKFVKWSRQDNGVEVKLKDKRMTSVHDSTIEVIPVWSPNILTVKYANGDEIGDERYKASGSMTDSFGNYGENIAIKNCAFTRAGYTFSGWKNSDTSASRVTLGWDSYPVGDLSSDINNTSELNKTITLTAQWTPIKYDIEFVIGTEHLIGSDIPEKIAKQSITVEEKVIKPADPVLSGFNFSGWFISTNSSTPFDFDNNITVGNKTIYGKWQGSTYTITHRRNYGAGSPNDQIVNYTASLTDNLISGLEVPDNIGAGEYNTIKSGSISTNTSRYDSSLETNINTGEYQITIPAGAYGNIVTNFEWDTKIRNSYLGRIVLTRNKIKIGDNNIVKITTGDDEGKEVILYENDE
jgi:uncharacterized repeat protein (TIGR02543 family)